MKDTGQRVVNVRGIGARSLLDRSHLSSSFSAINGMVNGRNWSSSTVGSSNVEQEIKPESVAELIRKPFSSSDGAPQTLLSSSSDKERASGSESEEIDIDIENDDGDENAILQSRSASPSSVYNKLLQQANVGLDRSAPQTLQDQPQSCPEEEEEEGGGEPGELPLTVNDLEEVSNSAVESDDCWTQTSDTALSSSGSSHKAEVLGGGPGEEEADLADDRLLELHEVKHISKSFFFFFFFLIATSVSSCLVVLGLRTSG